ncbi:MAG: TOBE domain-containing protein [Pseudomonadota bacterium]
MGEITKLPGRASGDRVETPLGALPLPLSLAPPIAATGSGPLVVCIRPEAVRVARAGDALLGEASVADAAFFGTHWRAQLIFEAAPETSLLAYLPPDTGVSEGQRLTVSVDPGAITVFEER